MFSAISTVNLLIQVIASLSTFKMTVDGVRLVDGSSDRMGSVQVQMPSSEWSYVYVCDDGFGFAEADAVCRQLGFDGSEQYTKNDFFGSTTPEGLRNPANFMPDRLNCTGLDDVDYTDCPLSDVARHDCTSKEVAGVICRSANSVCQADQFECMDSSGCLPRTDVCSGSTECSDGSDEAPELCTDVGVTRVVSDIQTNIPGAALGSVQVKHNETWGVMCDDRTTVNDSKVICRSMGYAVGWAVAFTGSYLGEAKGPMIVDSPLCQGTEKGLEECPSIAFGTSDCPTELEDFGVFCYDEGVEARLTGSGSPKSGQVELKMGGKWGTVCDSGFDIFDAQVICRMLGYDGDAVASRRSGRSQTGLMWDLRLDCLGGEKNIQDCRIRILESSCPLTHTASITCSRSRGKVEAELKAALGNPYCGIAEDASNKILTRLAKVRGGESPSRFDTPWLVSLRRTRNLKSSRTLQCGGSIISEDYILTAAHCVEVSGRLNVVVRVGDYNSKFLETDEEDYLIDKVWVHEFEDEHGFNDNDIALIKVERKNGRGIKFGPRVKPICLPTVYDDYEKLSGCMIAGWGPTFIFRDPEARPREAETDIVPDQICEGASGGPKNFTSSMVCVGRFSERVNACKGDSGGPLTCQVDGKQTLYGIVSSGKACGFAASADTFVRVTKFMDWVLDKVRSSQENRF